MSLVKRSKRPLKRDAAGFRDDRLFLVACDDTYAPAQYFEFFRIARVKVHVVPTTDGTSAARHVLDRLLKFDHDPDDERWLLLDTDHYIQGAHVREFSDVLAEARRHDVRVALSRPAFELWLLLHHLDESAVSGLGDARELVSCLHTHLGQYDKTALRSEHFPISLIAMACERASRLDALVAGGDIPQANTTRVYQLWQALVAKALPTQLPDELRKIATT